MAPLQANRRRGRALQRPDRWISVQFPGGDDALAANWLAIRLWWGQRHCLVVVASEKNFATSSVIGLISTPSPEKPPAIMLENRGRFRRVRSQEGDVPSYRRRRHLRSLAIGLTFKALFGAFGPRRGR